MQSFKSTTVWRCNESGGVVKIRRCLRGTLNNTCLTVAVQGGHGYKRLFVDAAWYGV